MDRKARGAFSAYTLASGRPQQRKATLARTDRLAPITGPYRPPGRLIYMPPAIVLLLLAAMFPQAALQHIRSLQHATQGQWGLSGLLKDGHRLWTPRLQVVVQRDPPHSAPQVFRCAYASASPAGSVPQVPDDNPRRGRPRPMREMRSSWVRRI